jgi:hypothetical protein
MDGLLFDAKTLGCKQEVKEAPALFLLFDHVLDTGGGVGVGENDDGRLP